MVYEILFSRLTQALEQPSQNISKTVHAGIWEPLYDICLIAELLNSEYDRLNVQDMNNNFSGLLFALLDLRANEPRARYTLQLWT